MQFYTTSFIFIFSFSLSLLLRMTTQAFVNTYLCNVQQGLSGNVDSYERCILCTPGFVLIDGYCYCPEGTFFNLDTASGYDFQCTYVSTAVNCLYGVYKTGAVHCSKCGYGTKLNSSNGNCQCLGNATQVQGGCTNIPKCLYVSYPTSTSERCISCNNTFVLQEGECVCPPNTVYNTISGICKQVTTSVTSISGCVLTDGAVCVRCGYGLTVSTVGTCICNGVTITGGCASIPACNYISYPTPQTQICISCNPTFILQLNKCICPTGLNYNITADQCTAPNTTTPSPTPNNTITEPPSNLLTETQIAVILGILGLVTLFVLGLVIGLYVRICVSGFPTRTNPSVINNQNIMLSQSDIGDGQQNKIVQFLQSKNDNNNSINNNNENNKNENNNKNEELQPKEKKRRRKITNFETIDNIDITITD